MTPESPRLAHNRALSAAYIASVDNPPRYPKVSDQVECLPLQHWKLVPFGYNPTITDVGGGVMMMCYRYHESSPATKLACATIGGDGNVSEWWLLPVNVTGSVEDPKLFLLEGVTHLSFVQSNFPTGLKAVVKYGILNKITLHQIVHPDIGKNDWTLTEKNWIFWGQDSNLFCLHQCHPTHRVFRVENGRGSLVAETPPPRWPYGEIRGGTTPIPYDGKLLRFFHSRADNELSFPVHRYFVGAYLMEPNPPFTVLRVSKSPVLRGSEEDDLTPEQRKACPHWKRNVVFPGGAVARDNGWLLSVGVNDSACVIAKVNEQDLHF